tara:strand:- start:487 stop:792 length:306 start_codon:yes stop_codon:yes gene_type:complete
MFMSDIQDQISKQGILDPAFRKRKLRMYFIRTAIAIALYWAFWSVSWVPYTLWFYVPINLLGLAMIVVVPRFLESNMRKAEAAMEEAQAIEVEAEIIDEEK